jgi:hypothetical protein
VITVISVGSGKYRVWLKETNHGDDIVLFLGGGEHTHAGSIIICEPGRKTRIINRKIRNTTHKDWIVGKPIAEKMCKKRKKSVLCIAGMHVDNASKEDIEKLKKNCRKIEEKL